MCPAVAESEQSARKSNEQFTPAQGFISRLQLEQQLIQRIKASGETYHFCKGLYQSFENSLLNLCTIPQHLNELLSNIGGTPPTFHDNLKTLVAKLRETKPTNELVVALDIGGGAGLSWAKVAQEFRDEIAAGQVAFIVSNLSSTPEKFLKPGDETEGMKLVHYIKAPFRRLCSQPISLPNGTKIPLRGNVDLAHENLSVTTWSLVPEVDILVTEGLLSKYGIYCLPPENKPRCYEKVLSPEQSKINRSQREIAVNQAHRTLEAKYGLMRIEKIEEGLFKGADTLYRFFRRPDAPPIEI